MKLTHDWKGTHPAKGDFDLKAEEQCPAHLVASARRLGILEETKPPQTDDE